MCTGVGPHILWMLLILFLCCYCYFVHCTVAISKSGIENDFVFALTLDGQLHALNPNGRSDLLQPLWSQQLHGPLIQGQSSQINLQNKEPSNALMPIEPIFLIEPVGNGTVYAYLPGEALQKLPLTMKQLVEHSPGRLADGTLYLGSRSSSVIELDLDTGVILNTLERKGKKRILLGKSFQHLQILKPSGAPRWNATLTNIEGIRASQNPVKSLFSFVRYHSSFNGFLMARSTRTKRLKWAAHFDFPVVEIFHLVPLGNEKSFYTLRSIQIEMKNPYGDATGENDLVNIGEIDSALFVLPQSRFPIVDKDRLFTQPQPVIFGDDEPPEQVIVYPQIMDNFDPTECFPGMPNFPDCLKGSRKAYKPFPVPLIEGETASTNQNLQLILSLLFGAATMFLFLNWKRRGRASSISTASSPLKVFEDEVLGYGSHGTVVFRGEFDGRPVAVKRMLIDFYDVAGQEVSLLQHSDHHPNVIRYYYRQRTEKFIMIALELCPQTLQSLIENAPPGLLHIDKKDIMRQIISGLEHLHMLNIVHRDIKPGNILITSKNRVVLSDFGVSKRLAADQMSFQATVATGTMGWRAPEVILSDEATHFQSQNSTASPINLRVTNAIDIFAAGCVFYYVQSGGGHPFGERLTRDANIIAGKSYLAGLGENSEALLLQDLIGKMIERKPERRPAASTVLYHPYFWDDAKRLAFLEAVSDRLERDDRTMGITNRALEAEKNSVFTQGVNTSWHTLVDRSIWDSTEHRKYFGNSLQDLLRLIRNKRHHWQELPQEAKRLLGDPITGYLRYFLTLFPNLMAYTWRVIGGSPFILEQPFCSEYYCQT